MRAILVQGDSVRMTWGQEEPAPARAPLRRDAPAAPLRIPAPQSEDILNLRLGEELDYVRRMLGAMADDLSADPILLRRHAVSLQSLDIVTQILTHVGNVIRSSDPDGAAQDVSMGDLRARLTRRNSV